MTSTNVIENQISSVKKYLEIVKRYEKYSAEEIKNDIDLRGTVERYLYLLVQSSIDLAESFVAHKKLRKPTTLSENFHILNEAGILETGLTEELVKMTGFRNVIAHDYEEVDYNIVYRVIHEGGKDIEKLLGIVEKNL